MSCCAQINNTLPNKRHVDHEKVSWVKNISSSHFLFLTFNQRPVDLHPLDVGAAFGLLGLTIPFARGALFELLAGGCGHVDEFCATGGTFFLEFFHLGFGPFNIVTAGCTAGFGVPDIGRTSLEFFTSFGGGFNKFASTFGAFVFVVHINLIKIIIDNNYSLLGRLFGVSKRRDY